MALRFADGFDQYNLSADSGANANAAASDELTRWWTQTYARGALDAFGTSSYATVNPAGRRGGQCIRFEGFIEASPLSRVLPDFSGATGVAGFAFRGVPNINGTGGWGSILQNNEGSLYPGAGGPFANASNFLCSFRYKGYNQLAVGLTSNGRLEVMYSSHVFGADNLTVFQDDPSAVIGTTTNALQFDTWHYIEVKVLTHLSTGTVELRVDGDVWLTLTGVRTCGELAGIDEIVIGKNVANATGNASWLFDDLYVLDTAADTDNDLVTFLGDVAIEWQAPATDGDVNNWTPSSGAQRYAMVDETGPDDDTTYIQSDTAGHVQTFTSGGSPISGATILAAAVMFLARRTEGGPSSTRPVVRIAGTTYELGAAKGNTTSYSYQAGFFNKLPSDHSAITEAAFAALQPGVKKVT